MFCRKPWRSAGSAQLAGFGRQAVERGLGLPEQGPRLFGRGPRCGDQRKARSGAGTPSVQLAGAKAAQA